MTRLALICAAVVALLLPPATASAQGGDFEYQVVGGHDATIQEYPWQAALVFPGSGNAFQRQFCGGVLITPRIVLTAAHCVSDGFVADDPGEINVVLGRTNLSDASSGEEKEVVAIDFENPLDGTSLAYNVFTDENDVGYLVLGSKPLAGTTAETIDIAADSEAGVWAAAPGVFNEVSGWGATAESGPGSGGSDMLQAASVPIVSDATCASPSYYDTRFKSSSMVCAGYPEGGIDTCFGDSGGPLQAPLEGDDEYRLIGLTSWGEGCARPNKPGVYARVAGDVLRNAIVARVAAFEADGSLGIAEGEKEAVVSTGGGTPKSGPPKYPPASSPPPPPPPPPSGFVPQQPPATTSSTITTDTRAKKKPFAKCRKIKKKSKKQKRKRKKCMRKVKKRLRAAR